MSRKERLSCWIKDQIGNGQDFLPGTDQKGKEDTTKLSLPEIPDFPDQPTAGLGFLSFITGQISGLVTGTVLTAFTETLKKIIVYGTSSNKNQK